MAAGDPGTPKRNYSSTAVETSLQSSIAAQSQGASNTSFIVASVSGFPSVPFTLVVDPDTSKEEVLTVTAANSTTLTVTRGEDSTQAVAHSAGAVVRHGVSGRDFREEQTHIAARGYDVDQAILDLANQTHVHGLASGDGSVVGTTKTQTLTNKTLTSPIITGGQVGDTGITFEGATGDANETFLQVTDPTADRTITLPDASGNIVLDTLTQTLTNKTLTSPTISGSPVITGLSSAGMVSSSATPKDYVDAILGSATAAATSAASAAASATAAATSATSAAASATAAATSASSASTSASSASTSASSASTQATNASNYATAAATSATSAANSATAAASSATTAANSVATIAGYATSAANSATAAATSATSAAASATAAATSATSAATSATAAATSASSASTSASSALTSANSAAVSAASAAAAVTTAIQASIIDAKGDLIVGSAADTAARLGVGTDGYILTASSTATNGLTWSAAPAGYLAPTIGTTVVTSGTTVSTITAVTLDNATLSGTLTAGATSGTNGYLLTSTGTGVQWAAAPVSLPSQTGNDGKLLTTNGTTASWAGAAPVAQTTEPTNLIDGLIWIDTDGTAPTTVVTRWTEQPAAGTTVLTGNDDYSIPLAYSPGYEQVFLNGVLLSRSGSEYTATNGTSITLAAATVAGDIVEVICPLQIATTDTYTQSAVNNAFQANTNNFAAGKNKIINGDFGIWQRGTSFNTATAYTADRWIAAATDATLGTYTATQQTFTPGTAPVAGYEGQYFWRYNRTVAGSGGSYYSMISQRIEDVRTFAGQTVTISFWAKGTATGTLTVGAFQSFGSGGSSGNNKTFGTFTVTGSWTRYTFTATLDSVSGKTIGTSSYISTYIDKSVTATGQVDLWGWQVEAGSNATAFQTATGTIQGELATCQRYYWRDTTGNIYSGFGVGTMYSTTACFATFPLPVTMRVAPSLSYSTLEIIDGAGAAAVSGVNSNRSTTKTGSQEFYAASAFATIGRAAVVRANNSLNAYMEWSAEL